MDLFSHTLFINLEQRTDRLAHITHEFQKMAIQGERVDAVKKTLGPLGCALSHIKCLELACERNFEQVFICEDDITFLKPRLLKVQLARFLANQDLAWDVLLIGGNSGPPYDPLGDYVVRVVNCQTCTGYVVRRHYYETLLANIRESAALLESEPDKITVHAMDMHWKQLQKRDRWYMITPPTVIQYENHSDIENKTVNYKDVMLDMSRS